MPTTSSPRDRVDSMLAFLATLEPERDASAKAIAWRLRRAARKVDTEVRRRLAPLGMELWELEILSGLRRAGGTLTVGDLLDVAQLTSGAITNRIARLERAGYVRRDVAPDDRRQVLVTLTPSGLERQKQAVEANNAAEQEIFDAIDPALQQRLSGDLRELLLAIEGPDPHAEAHESVKA
jgi:DNA-binding MarR family transcriptional regulator